MDKRLERILPRVQKPARYVGGEYNAVKKDPAQDHPDPGALQCRQIVFVLTRHTVQINSRLHSVPLPCLLCGGGENYAGTADKTINPNPRPIGKGFGLYCVGGPEGIRTLDLSDANRTLSQLSYKPI